MKYNMDIYCVGFTGCKACVFLLVLMQSLKTSTGCFPRVLFCKQKLLNHLSITHDLRLRKHSISRDPLTPLRYLARKYTGSMNFTACIVYNLSGVAHIIYFNFANTFKSILYPIIT